MCSTTGFELSFEKWFVNFLIKAFKDALGMANSAGALWTANSTASPGQSSTLKELDLVPSFPCRIQSSTVIMTCCLKRD